MPRIGNYERTSNARSTIALCVVSSTGNQYLRTADGRDMSNHVIFGGSVVRSLKRDERLANQTDYSKKSMKHSNDLWSDDFHDFELDWKPDKVTISVDGVEYDEERIETPPDQPVGYRFTIMNARA